MNGLESEFSAEIEFVWLDVDDSESLPLREAYGIVGRTHYVLVDTGGNAVQRWYGHLNEPEIEAFLEEFIAEQG